MPTGIFLPLEVDFDEDSDVAKLARYTKPGEARALRDLLVAMWRYCARHDTTVVPFYELPRLALPDGPRTARRQAARLAECGLIEHVDGLGWRTFVDIDAVIRRRGNRPHIPASTRRLVYDRDGWRCVYCGAPDPLSLDHVKPYSKGGQDVPGNLVTACLPCNWSRGAGRW